MKWSGRVFEDHKKTGNDGLLVCLFYLSRREQEVCVICNCGAVRGVVEQGIHFEIER